MSTLDNKTPLAIIGDEDLITGFKALGFEVYPIIEGRDFSEIIQEVLNKKTSICLLQDDIYLKEKDSILKLRHLPFPIFIPFSKTGTSQMLDSIVKDIRLKATGAY